MADVMSPEQRSRCMSRIRGKNTSPELRVRSLAHRMGYRFRIHRGDLPGKPDIVFPSRRRIILVHGCFWHLHSCSVGRRARPRTNAVFWRKKLTGNVTRDRSNLRRLQRAGWKVLTVWECQIHDEGKLSKRLSRFLGRAGEGSRNV